MMVLPMKMGPLTPQNRSRTGQFYAKLSNQFFAIFKIKITANHFMNKSLTFGIITAVLLSIIGCKNSETTGNDEDGFLYDSVTVSGEFHENPSDFIPEGYNPFDTIYGDLNKDGVNDLVYIIKGTDKSKFVIREADSTQLDRNRRGIIVLFKKDNGYELGIKNEECFSSENEEGGVYFAPELNIEIKKGNLFVNYGHGRYGYWSYTFRHKNDDFELIGYDSSDNMGSVTQSETSINFVTEKKRYSVNINRDNPDENDVFEDTWTKIKKQDIIKLSEIIDFEEFDFSDL